MAELDPSHSDMLGDWEAVLMEQESKSMAEVVQQLAEDCCMQAFEEKLDVEY